MTKKRKAVLVWPLIIVLLASLFIVLKIHNTHLSLGETIGFDADEVTRIKICHYENNVLIKEPEKVKELANYILNFRYDYTMEVPSMSGNTYWMFIGYKGKDHYFKLSENGLLFDDTWYINESDETEYFADLIQMVAE